MSLLKPNTYDGSFIRQFQQGDIFGTAETESAVTIVGSTTLTGAQLASNILRRSGPAAPFTDTTDSAANWIAALSNGIQVPQAGTTYRLRYLNTSGNVGTLAGGTGVTLTGTTVSNLVWRDYNIILTNVTPGSTQIGNTNTSVTITGMSSAATALVSVGMLVSGTGIQAGTLVTGVNPGVGVTLSLAATATATAVALTFSPTITMTSIGAGTV
jgi:hypothetical protein